MVLLATAASKNKCILLDGGADTNEMRLPASRCLESVTKVVYVFTKGLTASKERIYEIPPTDPRSLTAILRMVESPVDETSIQDTKMYILIAWKIGWPRTDLIYVKI